MCVRLVFRRSGYGFDPPVWQHSFVAIGHEIIFTTILSLQLIQIGQLSVLVNRLSLSLPRKSVVRLTSHLNMTVLVDLDIKQQNKQKYE